MSMPQTPLDTGIVEFLRERRAGRRAPRTRVRYFEGGEKAPRGGSAREPTGRGVTAGRVTVGCGTGWGPGAVVVAVVAVRVVEVAVDEVVGVVAVRHGLVAAAGAVDVAGRVPAAGVARGAGVRVGPGGR